MESKSPSRLAREQLESLSAGRDQALGRVLLPWRYVVAWAIVMNACMLAVVLPIVLSDVWTLAIQGTFTAAAVVLLLMQRRRHEAKRPKIRVRGSWLVTTICAVGFGAALAVAIYARRQGDAWLGVAALALNVAAYLVAYGGHGFLIRRQLARHS